MAWDCWLDWGVPLWITLGSRIQSEPFLRLTRRLGTPAASSISAPKYCVFDSGWGKNWLEAINSGLPLSSTTSTKASLAPITGGGMYLSG